MAPQVELIELDMHINDPAFAEVLVNTLLRLMQTNPAPNLQTHT
jgi:uncharacterized protein (UPF0261 family)